MPSISELLAMQTRKPKPNVPKPSIVPSVSTASVSASITSNATSTSESRHTMIKSGTTPAVSLDGTAFEKHACPVNLDRTDSDSHMVALTGRPEKEADENLSLPSNQPSNLKDHLLAKPVSRRAELVESASDSEPQRVPQFASDFIDEIREMASAEDFADVEQSANSLAEILNVVLSLPYVPDVFIDECLEVASQALDNQKRVYMQRVLSGEKQSGARNTKKATAIAMKVDLSNDDLFVLGLEG